MTLIFNKVGGTSNNTTSSMGDDTTTGMGDDTVEAHDMRGWRRMVEGEEVVLQF